MMLVARPVIKQQQKGGNGTERDGGGDNEDKCTPTRGLQQREGGIYNTPVVRSQTSRVGREKQRWEGDTRLITGCIPMLDGKVVMISSGGKKQGWIVPKGGWEDDETLKGKSVHLAPLTCIFSSIGIPCSLL